MKNQQQHTIPIVQQDLSHEETIVQIAFSLETLEKVVANIFSSIECEIERKKLRLHGIQLRCDIAKQQIQKLASIEKSIKVFSCYKYPATNSKVFYKDPVYRIVELEESTVKIKCSPLPPDKFSIKEKLKFYHVRDSSQLFRKNSETTAPLEGLGTFPSNNLKLSSVLLYNTNQNIYNQYQLVDPLSNIVKQNEAALNDDRRPLLEPDPISIGSSEPLGYKNNHHYFYSPSVQDVPDIKAPLNLPHLTGIAGDLNYDKIFREHEYDNVSVITEASLKGEAETIVNENEDENFIPDSPQPLPPLPPPPPVPPPTSFELRNDSDLSTAKNTKPEALVSTDARANLMEAIRQAGGKSRLKHISYDKQEQRSDQGKSLMDDLHEKLHMRRKGISGKIDNTDGMLDRIVSMIPPPPALVKQPENDDDEDWDD